MPVRAALLAGEHDLSQLEPDYCFLYSGDLVKAALAHLELSSSNPRARVDALLYGKAFHEHLYVHAERPESHSAWLKRDDVAAIERLCELVLERWLQRTAEHPAGASYFCGLSPRELRKPRALRLKSDKRRRLSGLALRLA